MDFEWLDIKVLVLAVVLSGIFIAMIWGFGIWESYPFRNKIIITIVLPIVSYGIVLWTLNKE